MHLLVGSFNRHFKLPLLNGFIYLVRVWFIEMFNFKNGGNFENYSQDFHTKFTDFTTENVSTSFKNDSILEIMD